MTSKISLVIADDHPLFRRGLREVIEENSQFEILGEAADGISGLRLIEEQGPQILLTDVDMPQLNGIELVRILRRNNSLISVIFLTMYKDEDIFNAALDLGVKGFIVKDNAEQDIVEALLKVARGEFFFSNSMSASRKRREDRVKTMLLNKPQVDSLTSSEKRILKLISEDRTSKEIADFLKISPKTVENHRMNMCNKLNLHGTHSLLKFAFDYKGCF